MPSIRYRSLLVGVDFSATSKRALQHAAALAAELHARLEVVHVFNPMRPTLPFSAPSRDVIAQLNHEARAEAKGQLDAWVEALPEGVNAHATVVTGKPPEGILKRANAVSADIVVLGEQGHNLAESILIGSTAERVARKARRPVLLVPKSGRGS